MQPLRRSGLDVNEFPLRSGPRETSARLNESVLCAFEFSFTKFFWVIGGRWLVVLGCCS